MVESIVRGLDYDCWNRVSGSQAFSRFLVYELELLPLLNDIDLNLDLLHLPVFPRISSPLLGDLLPLGLENLPESTGGLLLVGSLIFSRLECRVILRLFPLQLALKFLELPADIEK